MSWLTRHKEAVLLTAVAVTVLATRLAYLPQTLEDLDSINFDLGVHSFYPFGDRPHPPGYAVFIAAAKLVHPWFESHAAGLAFPSAVFSAIAVLPLYVLFRHLVGRPTSVLACALVMFNPIFWLNSVRPMSDLTGFAAVAGAQCLLVLAVFPSEATRNGQRLTWCLGVMLAGLAVGVRLQAVVLVGPILAVGFLRLRHLRLCSVAVFTATCALWLVPTVVASGGVRRHFARQAQVLAEAWPSEPLVSAFSLERLYRSVGDILVSPWGSFWLAGGVLLLAAGGAVLLWRDRRKSLAIVLLLFGPYALYHCALQSTNALRYSIPVLPLVAVIASVALVRLVGDRAPSLIVTVAVFLFASGRVTLPALEVYARGPSPPAEAVEYLRALAGTEVNPVVAGNFVFDRYLSALAESARIIRTKPNEEWRALNRFWVDGERRSIWFLRDPDRSILDLKDPEAQTRIASWEWPDPLMRLIRGARPTRIELVRLDPPRWFAESGFLLTSEAGPADRVASERHLLFVRADLEPHLLVVSGVSSQEAVVTVMVGKQARDSRQVDKHFSIAVALPPASATEAYVPVHLDSSTPLLLTGVTLDAAAETILPSTGFYAPERDELGHEFRWMGPRAEVAVSGAGAPIRVTVRGRVPVEYYDGPLTLRLESAEGQSQAFRLTERDFLLAIDLPAIAAGSTATLTLSSSRTFVPNDVARNGDRRSLAVRVYELRADRVDPRQVDAAAGGP